MSAVDTVRAARALEIRLHVGVGTCSIEYTSQASFPSHTKDAHFVATLHGRHVNFCDGCARRFLYGTAFWTRG